MGLHKGLTVFMHIPKTGGTTLHDALSRSYGNHRSLHITSVKTQFREEALKRAKLDEPFLVKGHLNLLEAADIPGSFVFTFLRHPIKRVISHYYFLKEVPSVKHYDYLNQPDTTIESFYALGEKKDIDNCMTRYISGRHETEFGKITEGIYQQALENLQTKITLFGLSEKYDESLVMLATEGNWPLPIYRKKNITKKKETVSKETMDFLREANKWDVLLFEKAEKIFAERESKMTPRERRRLSRLRFLNKVASAIPF